jgi:hypothetical protein
MGWQGLMKRNKGKRRTRMMTMKRLKELSVNILKNKLDSKRKRQ